MKTHKHLYETICTKENICEAYKKARLGKRKKFYVQKFELNVHENIEQLHQELVDEMPYFTTIIQRGNYYTMT